MELILITKDPDHARSAEAAGVRRIMVDLEQRGKRERQGRLKTRISNHSLDDVERLRGAVSSATLMVRINPLHGSSASEIARCIESGAEAVMLPMFTGTEEVGTFLDLLGGSARASLLVETPQALARLPEIVAMDGLAEVHIGLNDLHLAFGLTFMFELLSGGLVDHCSRVVLDAGLGFGFGGIAPLGQGVLPSDLLVLEHVRLGSTQTFMSRAFEEQLGQTPGNETFVENVRLILDRFGRAASLGRQELDEAHAKVRAKVAEVVRGR